MKNEKINFNVVSWAEGADEATAFVVWSSETKAEARRVLMKLRHNSRKGMYGEEKYLYAIR